MGRKKGRLKKRERERERERGEEKSGEPNDRRQLQQVVIRGSAGEFIKSRLINYARSTSPSATLPNDFPANLRARSQKRRRKEKRKRKRM